MKGQNIFDRNIGLSQNMIFDGQVYFFEMMSFEVKCDAVTSQSTEMCSLLTRFVVLLKNAFSPM